MTSNIESLDTNIIANLVLMADRSRVQKITDFIFSSNKRFYIDDQVITELVFLLEKKEKFTRPQIFEHLEPFFCNSIFITSADLFHEIFPFYIAHPKLSFNDCYLAAKSAIKQAEPLWTLDHKLALQSPSAKELK